MEGQTDGGKGWRCKPFSCHLPNPSITFLISLSLYPPFWLSGPLSLNCISVSLQMKFSPVPSLSPSIIPSIPSPFFCLFLSPRFFSPHHLSLPSKQDITLPPNSRYPPPAPEEKVKIYKTAIFRFMCHGQTKI